MLIGNFILSPVTIQSSTYNAACSWIRIESLPLSLSPNNPASASRNWTALDRRMRWLQIQFQCKYTRQCRGNGNWIKYSDTETDRIRIQIALSLSSNRDDTDWPQSTTNDRYSCREFHISQVTTSQSRHLNLGWLLLLLCDRPVEGNANRQTDREEGQAGGGETRRLGLDQIIDVQFTKSPKARGLRHSSFIIWFSVPCTK